MNLESNLECGKTVLYINKLIKRFIGVIYNQPKKKKDPIDYGKIFNKKDNHV